MIFLFTDFGYSGPYVGQMKSVLYQLAPHARVVDLMHDAPRFNPRASAYLLAALAPRLPEASVVVAVVDPGVGGERKPVILRANSLSFVGPDNGLLEIVARRANVAGFSALVPNPRAEMSSSFHGRDLFAPSAAQVALGEPVEVAPLGPGPGRDWPDDLAEVIYIDKFGNAMTGLRASMAGTTATLNVGDMALRRATTFSDVARGEAFWYENSSGLVEIAVNQGSAAEGLRIQVGSPVVLG